MNVTRNSPGCTATLFDLNLSYNSGNVSVGKYMQSWLHLAYLVQLKLYSALFFIDTEGTCQFHRLQLQANCTINLNQKNQGIETSRVQGVVTLKQGLNSCNESKTIFVYNG